MHEECLECLTRSGSTIRKKESGESNSRQAHNDDIEVGFDVNGDTDPQSVQVFASDQVGRCVRQSRIDY